MIVDVKKWQKRNTWRTTSGALAVRPGLRRIYTPDEGRELCGGFSVRNDRVGATLHHVFSVSDSTTARDCTMHVFDGAFGELLRFQYRANVVPRALTDAVVFGQHLICSPDLPTLWGRVGNGYRIAESKASDSGAGVLATIPRGISTTWNNRAIICEGRNAYVTDPIAVGGGDLRSIIGENAFQLPGHVYGVHQAAGGMVVFVTSAGVFGLDSSASARAIVGAAGADLRLLNHNAAVSYESSAVVRGRVFGLTEAGFALIDAESASEQVLSEIEATRYFGPRIVEQDWRRARLFAGDLGPIVGHARQFAAHFFDMIEGEGSWWTHAGDLELVGVLRDHDGEQMLIHKDGVRRIVGDFDGEVALTSGITQSKAVIFGALPVIPSKNRDVLQVHAAAAVGGVGSIAVALRGSQHSAIPVVDPEGFTIGADTWTSAKRATSTPMSDVRIKFGPADARPTREPTLEIAVDGCLSRIAEAIDVEEAGGAERRPSKVG